MPLGIPLCALVLAGGGASSAPPARHTAAEPIYAALTGAWVGTLEYRDYSTNARVVLPTVLDVRRVPGAPSLDLHYIYDDGPTKVVQDAETVTIDPAGSYKVVSADGKETSTDELEGLGAFLRVGKGTLVRRGKGQENGKAVDVRTTLTASATRLTILKETRVPGGAFQFRDEYQLMRVKPAVTGK